VKNFIIISGCSCGGKSTLLRALRSKGYKVVEEAGRRVVQTERKTGGEAIPWKNMPLFLERAIELAIQDYEDASNETAPVFFDRSLIDLILAYEHFTGSIRFQEMIRTFQYAPNVYFAPPWPEIYVNDREREHSFDDAISEYKRLEIGYPKFGYELEILPKTTVQKRAELILENF